MKKVLYQTDPDSGRKRLRMHLECSIISKAEYLALVAEYFPGEESMQLEETNAK